MKKCYLCEQGDPSVNVRCYKCQEVFHLHKSQLDLVSESTVIIGDCPSCGTPNCWTKRGNKVFYSGLVEYEGQLIIDMRSRRPKAWVKFKAS